MPLFAENKTTAPHQLMPRVLLPAAPAAGKLGKKYNVTSELRGLNNYDALESQVEAGQVQFHWVGDVEYETPGLTLVIEPKIDPEGPVAPGPDAKFGTSDDVYPVLSATIVFGEPDFETGHARSLPIFDKAPYRLRIIDGSVTVSVTRGAKDALMYLCAPPCTTHIAFSDKFDVSQPGKYIETSHLADRVLEAGDALEVTCTNDYVLGRLTLMYQRIAE